MMQEREGDQAYLRLIQVFTEDSFAENQRQCYVRLPGCNLIGQTVRFTDLMGPDSHDRDGSDLMTRGLYLDMPPWSFHVFAVVA